MQPFLFGWAPSGFEWVIILIVALLIWGHKLPNIARSLGTSVNEFKKGAKEGETQASAAPGATSPAATASAAPVTQPAQPSAPAQPVASTTPEHK